MASALCSRIRQSVGGTILSGTTDAQKTGREQETVGMQSVPQKSAVEVRAVFEELLLFEAMSECELAYCSQACLL